MFCPWAGFSLQTQSPRLQLCPKAGFPPQTRNHGCSFTRDEQLRQLPVAFLTPVSLQLLNRSEKMPGAPAWRWGEWIWLTGPSGLHRNSPHGLNISSIRVFDEISDPEIPITHRQALLGLLRQTALFKRSLFYETQVVFLKQIDIILFNAPFTTAKASVAIRREMNMVLHDYDGQMIPGDECGLNFLKFVLQLRENPRKPSTSKSHRGSNPGPLGERQRIYHQRCSVLEIWEIKVLQTNRNILQYLVH